MNRQVRKNMIRLLFLPLAIVLWIVGWSMLWAASNKKQKGRSAHDRGTTEEDLITLMLLIPEEIEA